MTLAPNRIIPSVDNIVPDVSLRVDEWLRGVPIGDTTGIGSEPSRLSTITGMILHSLPATKKIADIVFTYR